jgi:hypothetical protein
VSGMSSFVLGLHITEHVTLCSGLVTRFPLFVALVSAFAFFSVTCTILAACFLPTILKRSGDELVRAETPTTPVTSPETVEKRQPGPSFEDIVPPRRIKRSRRSRSRSTDDGFVRYLHATKLGQDTDRIVS